MWKPRTKYRTSICYYLITQHSNKSYSDFITAPREFSFNLNRLLPLLPIDLIQITDPSVHYFLKCNEVEETCLNFNILYEKDFFEYIDRGHSGLVKVLLLDGLTRYDDVIQFISKMPNTYFTFLSPEIEEKYSGKILNMGNYFYEATELVSILRRDIHLILTDEEKKTYDDYFEKIDSELSAVVQKIPIFKAAHTNFFIECQCTGNYWINKDNVSDYTDEFLNNKRKQILEETVKGLDKDSRLQIFLEQIRRMDAGFEKQHVFSPITDIDPVYPCLVVVLPFQNPQAKLLSEIYKVEVPQVIHQLLKSEQNRNFIFSKAIDDEKHDLGEMANAHMEIVARIVYPRLLYLDLVKYLHATFTFSPSIRLPLLGNSIIKELSFLQPSTKNRLSGKSLNKTISKFGKRLAELGLNQELENYISKRNSQIVVISDLPVEWLMINGLALANTHDVCRVPETNLKNPMSIYAMSKEVSYTIPDDVCEKTLVVFGTPKGEEYYEKITNVAIAECDRLSIKYVRCFSVNDFIVAIKENQPELLIIDCHGDYDQKTLSSYLEINGEKLTHETIVENGLTAPLIFLSACATSPNYGYVHSIANAFFSNGALSITSTYLPISILNGTNTYLRLLWHLDSVAKSGEFPNWLAYVSMSVRNSIFNLIVEKIATKLGVFSSYKRKELNKIYKELDKIKDLLVAFPKRRQSFEMMQKLLNNIDENISIDVQSIVQEHLLYTHLGRSDLIKFERWIQRKTLKRATKT